MRPVFRHSLLSTILLTCLQPGFAAEWWMQPSVTLKAGYIDNINLTNAPHDGVFESELRPAADFGVRTPTSGIEGNARLQVLRFTGGSGRESSSLLNREYGGGGVNLYHVTETDRLSTGIDFWRDDTLESTVTFTGQVTDRVSRDRLTIAPQWTRNLTPQTSLTAGYNFTSIRFGDELQSTDLIEYDYQVLSGSLDHILSPLTKATLSSAYSKYQPDGVPSNDTINLQAGLSRQFTPSLTASILAGVRQTMTETSFITGYCVGAPPGASIPDCGGLPGTFRFTGFGSGETTDNGTVYSASLAHEHETGSNNLSVSRTSTPSVEGGLLDTLRIVLSSQLKISTTLSAELRANYAASESIGSTVSGANVFDAESFRATPSLRWTWSRELTIIAGVEHLRSLNQLTPDAEVAKRNSIFISLQYRPPRRSLSR